MWRVKPDLSLPWACSCPATYKLCDPGQVLHVPEPVSSNGDREYAVLPCGLVVGLKQTRAVPRLGACWLSHSATQSRGEDCSRWASECQSPETPITVFRKVLGHLCPQEGPVWRLEAGRELLKGLQPPTTLSRCSQACFQIAFSELFLWSHQESYILPFQEKGPSQEEGSVAPPHPHSPFHRPDCGSAPMAPLALGVTQNPPPLHPLPFPQTRGQV